MKIPTSFYLLLLCSFSSLVISFSHCPDCGRTHVPFPLSTNPHCGDPSYKVRCHKGSLWFNALNGSSYMITTISSQRQRFVIRQPGLAGHHTCVSSDFRTQGMWLDPNGPFNITSSNTLVLMNCSEEVLTLLWNCSSSSICHTYVKARAAKACSGEICCTVKTGGSATEYRIRVRKERCAAYVSFPNLDDSAPVSEWPEPGVEIEWELPQEPVCKVPADCGGLANSACSPSPVPAMGGVRKCSCNSGFQWDPVNGICQNIRCEQGRGCTRHSNKKALLSRGLAFAAAAMITGILIAAMVFRYRRRKATQLMSVNRARDILDADNNSGRSAKIFTIKDVTKATNNFSKHNLLGSGGFGEVFMGTLADGTLTAIKRAKLGNSRAVEQILNEVRILCQINHRSLVRLLGCCIDLHNEPLLVYEYVPNGTLYDHLHNTNKWAPLRWHRRLKIAHQTAEGLSYLHNSAIPRIFHRDIKSSNILLDHNLNAKVSDFGLSKLALSEASHITTCAQGTLGYLDPEYYLNFQLTDKSDVYSFGVVLLEILTSKKALDFGRDEEDVNLVVLVKRAMKNTTLMEVIDPMVKMGASKSELDSIKTLGCLAIACLDEQRQNRPSMKDAADEIEHILQTLSSDTGFMVEASDEFFLQ
ncbi:wall-associated receptor kinase-like 20 [Neltuma alba]|uniref:wall-associated receptor kinase-like 20 n=1 Tax=Neltuma alba TaxID=207710 RepID=UPI0010A41FC2|nr:wall-associated receptor kinase-like 20 [Prosopis alba]